jgi:hypothetical protein
MHDELTQKVQTLALNSSGKAKKPSKKTKS